MEAGESESGAGSGGGQTGWRRVRENPRIMRWKVSVKSVYEHACSESLKVVSQCFKSRDMTSYVTLYCGHQHFIDVQRAVHGRRPVHSDNNIINYCDVLPADCLSDVTAQYDWSACHGQRHCVHSLRHFNNSDHSQQQCVVQRLSYLQVS